MELVIVVLLVATVVLSFLLTGAKKASQAAQRELEKFAPFTEVLDAHAAAEEIRQQTATLLAAAEREADEMRNEARLELASKKERAESILAAANSQASQIVEAASKQAETIAGDAYRALKEADGLREATKAMQNLFEGYGDKYLKPTYSLLDELADRYGFDEAGKQLKQAREITKSLVEADRAASCEYVEPNRKETAIRFVVDAFNGKVDSILSRSKSDNFGTLEQQIRDAYALVNYNGSAFRNARINPEFVNARLAELKWANAVHLLREKEKEEQRRIREQIREEEKAQREIERALKDAARDEEALLKAVQKVQAQADKAKDDQRAEFEAKLVELQVKLAEAEAKNQRALSMAQQTRAGHVYIISNVGSLGEEVFKVGMTRRLEPYDRIRELGDASVPFSFDVHAMIWSDDAPALERSLHRKFLCAQINKVNPRKEFFAIPLSEIRKHLEEIGVTASWTMTADAAEYRESLAISKQLNENTGEAQQWIREQLELTNTVIPSTPPSDSDALVQVA